MKKKKISFGLIILFLLTSLSTASAVETNTDHQTTVSTLDLADLIVEEITVEPIYSYYFDDYDLVVNATIKNQGGSTAYYDEFPNVWWSRFYIDGVYFDSDRIISLEPGDTQKIQGTICHWEKEPDDYEIKVWADWLNRVEESNEINNNKTVIYTQKSSKNLESKPSSDFVFKCTAGKYELNIPVGAIIEHKYKINTPLGLLLFGVTITSVDFEDSYIDPIMKNNYEFSRGEHHEVNIGFTLMKVHPDLFVSPYMCFQSEKLMGTGYGITIK